jgi:OOP family OmpA-OmpF porin
MKKTLLSIMAVSAVSAVSMTTAQAFEDIPHYNNRAYVWDTDGYVVRDRWGNCVRTIHWTEDSLPCGTDPNAKAEPMPTPVPASPVTVVEPQPEPEAAPAPAELNKPEAFRGFFDTNKATLRALAKDKLDIYADYMKRVPGINVEVVGHTDSRGRAAYNLDLSQRRADSVKAYLIEQGIDADRIRTDGQGETNPVASNDTAEGRQDNRRVELTIVE